MRRLAVLLLLLVPASAKAQLTTSPSPTPLPASWRKGLDVTAFWYTDLSGKHLDRVLRQARTEARAEELTFVVPWYQYFSDLQRTDDLDADEIHPSFGSRKLCAHSDGTDRTHCKTPSLAATAAAIRKARALGFKVYLRPQVEVGKTDKRNQPRDLIDKGPGQRTEWFNAYKLMLSQYARIARDTGADGLVVGAGLSGMTNDDDDRNVWRSIVADIRSGALMGDGKGYTGALSYAAEWDAVVQDAQDPTTHLSFWDALDEIDVDAFFPLVDLGDPNPSESELRQGWLSAHGGLPLSPVQIVENLHAEYDKPVHFSALGYLSRTGTAAFPEKDDYAQMQAGGQLTELAQSRPVAAAFDVWSAIAAEGWFTGISWEEWPASGTRGGPKDGSFSLAGKRALTLVCRRDAAGTGATCPKTPARVPRS